MQMKKLIYILPTAIIAVAALVSCQDMMRTDSDSYLFEENNKLDQAPDSMYSAIGILTQIQKVGERYVLFGELRGDLVTVPETAPYSMQEISNFNVTADNEYLSLRDYYSIINNCNYAIAHMDTSITIHSSKVMMPEYAAIKTMRAWTYLQMGLAFGKVKYFTEPILTVDKSIENIPYIGFDELIAKLAAEIEPIMKVNMPQYGSVDGYDSKQFFIQPQLLLADLALYKNQYETAAMLYYDYIDRNDLTMSISYANVWQSASRDNVSEGNVMAYNNEVISRIPYASDAKMYHPNMVNLTYNTMPSVMPAQWFVSEMNTKPHYYNQYITSPTQLGAIFEGDIRGHAVLANNKGEVTSAFGEFRPTPTSTQFLITKFFNNGSENSGVTNPNNEMFADGTVPRLTRSIATYRTPSVYLRYAEAINRAGKPTLAFAVLKYGLKQSTINDSIAVDQSEMEDKVAWTNFNNSKYDDNWGTGMRGCGYGLYSTKSEYLIPSLAARQDTICWVEEEILKEMSAETCFEGNRFFDLLRVSRHNVNPNAFFAEKVSRRFDNPEAMKAKLANSEAWWIKAPK